MTNDPKRMLDQARPYQEDTNDLIDQEELSRIDDREEMEKGKKMPVGTSRKFGARTYVKVAEGKWRIAPGVKDFADRTKTDELKPNLKKEPPASSTIDPEVAKLKRTSAKYEMMGDHISSVRFDNVRGGMSQRQNFKYYPAGTGKYRVVVSMGNDKPHYDSVRSYSSAKDLISSLQSSTGFVPSQEAINFITGKKK